MSRLVDLTGKRFGHLLVLERAPKVKGVKPEWICQCDCGNRTIVKGAVLKRGQKSCGCINGKQIFFRKTHANRLYNIWSGMKYRCECVSSSGYSLYGGRGISITPEWNGLNGFENFAEWSISHGYSENLEIDRIDNNGNYSPENCRWVTHEKNSQNRGHEEKIKGVSFRPNRSGVGGKYRASISVHSKHIGLGSFETLDEAIEARKQAELKYWGNLKSE